MSDKHVSYNKNRKMCPLQMNDKWESYTSEINVVYIAINTSFQFLFIQEKHIETRFKLHFMHLAR